MNQSAVMSSPSYAKARATAATVTTYTALARNMARDLYELQAAARWAVSTVRDRIMPPRRIKTIFIGRYSVGSHGLVENRFFSDARAYLATRIDTSAMSRLCLTVGSRSGGGQEMLSIVPGDEMTDVFEGVEFTWTLTLAGSQVAGPAGPPPEPFDTLTLSFDAEHTEVALSRYVPFIRMEMDGTRRRDRALKIYMNEGPSWHGITHHHPSTFDTLAMDPALKQSVIDDLDRFLKRRDYYRRIGKAWKRGYLLYGPPGTGKSSLVAAVANYLRFNLYDLDLSQVHSNTSLQKLITAMPNRSILLIEDIDCCFSTKSREGTNQRTKEDDDGSEYKDCSSADEPPPPQPPAPPRAPYYSLRPFLLQYTNAIQGPSPVPSITLSGLLNFIDGLWSTSGEERIIIFTTNYKDRLDPALLRPGRMDMHIYMGYCGWEAFKTLAKNYFLVDDHPLFPELQELISQVEVTPAEVSEMLLRSEDPNVSLQEFVEFLQDKKKQGTCTSE